MLASPFSTSTWHKRCREHRGCAQKQTEQEVSAGKTVCDDQQHVSMILMFPDLFPLLQNWQTLRVAHLEDVPLCRKAVREILQLSHSVCKPHRQLLVEKLG